MPTRATPSPSSPPLTPPVLRPPHLPRDHILRTIHWPDSDRIRALREANDECERAAETGAIDVLSAANRRFHFMMFEQSPLAILRAEIERVRRVSDPYRALYLSVSARRGRVASDHRAMLEAIEDHDPEELVRVMDAHRLATRTACWTSWGLRPGVLHLTAGIDVGDVGDMGRPLLAFRGRPERPSSNRTSARARSESLGEPGAVRAVTHVCARSSPPADGTSVATSRHPDA
ncbi:GntR family transcriptional regulator [Nocardia rhamnosiphila]|uniref:FCD domain-containing protein n=1 Tax=Nocardia rhamnosiphila TaxID=426716 RepID=A0ABV2WYM9_9NOCA